MSYRNQDQALGITGSGSRLKFRITGHSCLGRYRNDVTGRELDVMAVGGFVAVVGLGKSPSKQRGKVK